MPDPNSLSLREAPASGLISMLGRTTSAFFATYAVRDLRHWSHDSVWALGPLPLPMRYDRHDDRYHPSEWQKVLSEIGYALAEAESIILIGDQLAVEELETLQLLLANWSRCNVELLMCSDRHGTEHVRLEGTGGREKVSAGRRLVIALGEVPVPSVLGIKDYDMLVCICQNVSPIMFEVAADAIALPVREAGLRLSHVAFHRLIDIEAEQTMSPEYTAIASRQASPTLSLGSIVAELRHYAQLRRLELMPRPALDI